MRRARPTLGNTLRDWLPFRTRVWLHIPIVIIIGSSALVGGGRLLSQPGGAPQAAPDPALWVESLPTAETVARFSLSASTPTSVTSAASKPYEPPGAAADGSPTPSPKQDMLEALSLPEEPEKVVPTLGPAEDVMVARAMASSRGGMRAPDPSPTASPTPSPTPTPAPTPTPPPTPTPKKEPQRPWTYSVAAGDTLLAIAHRYGITPETILWANDLGNGDMLQIGEELIILPISGVLHEVKPGETTAGIAERYVADAQKIVDANLLVNADNLQIGQILIIPDGMMRTIDPTFGLPASPSAQELEAAPKYTVEQGDTLVSIADAFRVRPSTIQVANDLLNPDLLKIGQVLAIPGGTPPSAAPSVQPAPAPPAPAPAAPKPTLAPAPAPPPPPPPPDPAPAPASSNGDRVAAIAQKYLGYRYVWGGHSPSGFDCSGYTWYVYKEAGITIPMHDLWGQLNAGPRISRDQLLPGDLVFWQNTYKAGLSHSGLYLGGGRFINAETEATGVQIRNLSDPYWAARYLGASRPW